MSILQTKGHYGSEPILITLESALESALDNNKPQSAKIFAP